MNELTVIEKMGEALLLLLEQKPFDKITVDEITAVAGVGRATYFRNCSSKDDLLSSYLLESYKRYYAGHSTGAGVHEKSAENLFLLFSFCFQEQEVHRKIVSAGHEMAIYDAYRKSFSEEQGHEHWTEVFHSALIDFGLFGVIHSWIMSGCLQSPQEMVDWFLSIIQVEK